MKRISLLLAAGLLAAMFPSASARTIHVSEDGPSDFYAFDETELRWCYYDSSWNPVWIDGEPGDSWDTAFSSIDYACSAAEAGDTVLVAPGTYGPFWSDGDKGITIRSTAGAAQTFVDANQEDGTCAILGATDRLVGFTLRNATENGLYGGQAEGCVIRDCGSVQNERSAISGAIVQQYAWGGGACDAVLTDCVIENCMGNGAGGALSCTLDRCIVRNCRGNEAGGLANCVAHNSLIAGNRAEVMDSADTWEGYCGGAADSTLRNCTVVGNYAQRRFGGVGGAIETTGGRFELGACTVLNSIVVNNTCAGGAASNYGQKVQSSDVVGSTFLYSCTSPLPSGTGNTATAPRFADTTTYALASGSAGINAGNNAQAHGSHDLRGLPRLYGARVDMGATETIPASQICTVHFNANGGLVEVDSMLGVIGTALGVLPVPYRDGWRFEGWFDNVNPARGNLVTAQTKPTGRNLYLYASWTEESGSAWQPVYRFYSAGYKGHFYTIDPEERATLMCTNPNWKYEGVSYYAATEAVAGTVPLHRFYSANYRGHFFTIDETEMWNIRNTDRNWNYEGVAFYVYPSLAADPSRSAKAIHRFWSNRYRHHFFTIDEDEMWNIRNTDRNWSYEGVAFYACPNEPAP